VVRRNTPDLRWLISSPGWVKLNCDGSFKHEDGTAGAGMILCDDTGRVIFSACRRLLSCRDPFEAEGRACEEGIRLALQWSDKPTVVELDCSVLVHAIKQKNLDRSTLAHLIAEIRDLVNNNRHFTFVKVKRSQNRVSH
jgi:ribonuclease HI